MFVDVLTARICRTRMPPLCCVSRAVAGAILIGVDLGPNLSVTGSLATILWLGALRREGLQVGT